MDTSWFGAVPALDAAATLDDESGAVTLFAVNRNQNEPLALGIDVRARRSLAIAEHTAVYDDDLDAVNSAQQPDRVTRGSSTMSESTAADWTLSFPRRRGA